MKQGWLRKNPLRERDEDGLRGDGPAEVVAGEPAWFTFAVADVADVAAAQALLRFVPAEPLAARSSGPQPGPQAAGAAPVALAGSLVAFSNKPTNGALKATDAEGDALVFSIVNQPAAGQGSVALNGTAGSYTYTPNGFSGSTSFTFRVTDGNSFSTTQTVSVTASNTAAPTLTTAILDETPYASTPASDAADANALLGYLLDPIEANIQGILPNWNVLRAPGQAASTVPLATLFFTFDLGYSSTRVGGNVNGALSTFNESQKAAARLILIHVTQVTGIAFAEVGASADADFHFAAGDIDLGSTTAGLCLNFASFGFTTPGLALTSYNAESVILLDIAEHAGINTTPVAGDAGYEVLLHEVGHALGLGHPFEAPLQYRLPANEDNTNNTVMSYEREGAFKSTFQPYDRLALRWIYGDDGLGGTWGFNSFHGPSLTLLPPNSTPTASNGTLSLAEDAGATGGQLPAATDADGHAVSYSKAGNPSNGSATVNANGSYSYTPNANFNGSDSFTFRVTDTQGAFNTYTLNITVTPVNDAPTVANAIADQNATALAAFSFQFASNTFADVEGSTLTYSATQQGGAALPAWLSFTPGTRSFSGTPGNANVGTLNIQVSASDGSASVSDVFTLTVAASANQAPVASNTSINVTEDMAFNGSLPAATDANDNPITYARTAQANNGTAVVNANGSFSYTPSTHFNGSDSFGYSVSDGILSNSYTVTVTVAAVNDAPTVANAIADQNATALAAFSFQFSGNTFADVEGSTLTYSATQQGGAALPAWLSFTPGSRSFGGTPGNADVGSLNVQVSASDGSASVSDVFTLTVAAAANQAPVAAGVSIIASEDTVFAGSLPVATDANGDPITYSLAAPPEEGAAVVNANGTFSYTPGAEFAGNDSFEFTVSDGRGGSNRYTVSVTVLASNDAPVLAVPLADRAAAAGVALDFSVPEGSFTDVDSALLSYSAALSGGAALPGWLSFDSGTRAFTGTAGAADVGTVSIRVTASDGTSSANDVFLLVVSPNEPPTASNTSINATEDMAFNGNLPAATDSDGDPVSYALATPAAKGTVVVNGNGSFSYSPNPNSNGGDSFAYRVADNRGGNNVYTVTVAVAAVNDAPVVSPLATSTAEDTPLDGTLSASDVEGSPLTFSLATAPTHGTVVVNGNGSFRYTPAADFFGADNFSVRANDGTLDSAAANVGVIVLGVNDAPVATSTSAGTAEDTPLSVAFVASDVDHTLLNIVVITPPVHGTIEITGDAAQPGWRYTPAANFNGGDSFRWLAGDGSASSAIATVSLTVTPVNDAPVADAGIGAAVEDTLATGTVTASDIDSSTLGFTLVQEPAHGSLELLSDGRWTYMPQRDFNGNDSFSFFASDDLLISAERTVSIRVAAVNDLPLGSIVITGQTLLGRPLGVQHDLQDPDDLGSLAYRWSHADNTAAVLGTTASYTPQAADIGRRLVVELSWTDGDGTLETRRSSPSAEVLDSASLAGSEAAERLDGGTLPESLNGGGGADSLTGAGANDTLDGGAGNDSIDGGDGFDLVSYASRSVAVVASLGLGIGGVSGESDLLFRVEALAGGSGDDRLDADAGDNRLEGGTGNDTLNGGAGNDTLLAGAGNDSLSGGAGDADWADYSGVALRLIVNLGAGTTRNAAEGEIAEGAAKHDLFSGIEHLRGGSKPDVLDASAATLPVWLDGGPGDDELVGGTSEDVLIGGLGVDILVGGLGYDTALYGGSRPLQVDLADGSVRVDGIRDELNGIEAVVGSSADDSFTGIDDTHQRVGQLFKGLGGNDTIAGGAGVDQAHYRGNVAEYQIVRDVQADTIGISHRTAGGGLGIDGQDFLHGIERLRFADKLLAFGTRAEEVARVAFVLWTPDIAPSTGLWARGISFYDAGYDYRTLVQTALFFHPVSDADLAAQLVRGTPGTPHTATSLLALMAANGGGENGRIVAVTVMAESAQTYEQVRLAGFARNGIVGELNFGDQVLFMPLPDGA